MQIPVTSAFEPLKQESYSNKHIIALNKADLADRSMTEVCGPAFGTNTISCVFPPE